MQLGSLELQIFVALFLVLGSAFVALVCDFLKGNNEQLRERNIELRVRQDERERLGLFEPLAHPITWLQGLAQLVRNPGLAEAVASTPAAAAPAAAPAPANEASEPDLDNLTGAASPSDADASDRNPQRRHRYDEFKAAAKQQSWATKEELEQLAGRAARIRARHEASHRKPDDLVVAPPAAELGEQVSRPKVAEFGKPEQPKPAPQPIAMPAPASAKPKTEIEAPTAPAAARTKAPVEPPAPRPAAPVTAPPVAQPAAVVVPTPVRQQVAVAAPVEAPPPPPMAQAPAASGWTFPAVRPAPIEPGQGVGAADLIPQVIRPEAPPLASSLPSFERDRTVPDAAAETPAAAAERAPIEEPVTVAVEPPQKEISIWLRPEDAAAARVAPPEPVLETPAIVGEAPVSSPIPKAQQPEPMRTRIQAIEIPPFSDFESTDEDTADLTPPAPQVAAAASVPAPVVDTAPLAIPAPPRANVPTPTLPSLDVAALQKATGASQAAPVAISSPFTTENAVEVRLEIPAGLHDAGVLSTLLENQSPYCGVVVAIGLNDYDTLRDKLASGTDSVAALNKMVLSMLRPQDFACRFQDDEYILIYPNERGSSAQRRLFQVSEKLWDFQLRSLGNLSVMFSWGGLEVTNETLSEAVASARERMYQTKRNRKPSGLEFAGAGRKKVVNG